MADFPEDLIETGPITIKREFVPVTQKEVTSTFSFEKPDDSSRNGYFLPGENYKRPETGVNGTYSDEEDEVDTPSDDPLGDVTSSNVVIPMCSSREMSHGKGGFQDETEEIEGTVNEYEESIPQVHEVVPVKYEDEEVLKGYSTIQPASPLPPIGYKKKTNNTLKAVKTAICLKCNTGFPSTDLYEHHMSTVHEDDRPYPCQHCNKRFRTSQQCRRHETIHDQQRFKGPPKFACDICDKRYHLRVSMATHRRRAHFGYKSKRRALSAPLIQHHARGTQNPKRDPKPKQIFPCPHCDLTFPIRYLLREHMRCHTKEKPFSCHICQQPFTKKCSITKHIRTVHEQETPSGAAHPTPKWKANRTYSCSICNKLSFTESRHRYHMRAHKEDRTIECKFCAKKFKRPAELNYHVTRKHRPDIASNPLKLFKCLICGQGNFCLFTDLCDHRRRHHNHIPYDSEKEKPFVCGVCGKPHFLRERAIICAILGHDSTSLRHKMFRHQCPECPPEMLGYRNLTVLRSHWKEAHGEKPLPPKLRMGMYSETDPDMTLPTVTIDKKKAEEIRNNGPPAELLKGEIQLFTERDLLPIPKEERFKSKAGTSRLPQPLSKYADCDICGVRICRQNLSRHMKTVHDPAVTYYNCASCRLRFKSEENLRVHEKVHQNLGKRRSVRQRKQYDVIITPENVAIKKEDIHSDEQEASFQEMNVSPCSRANFAVESLHEKRHSKPPRSTKMDDSSRAVLRLPKNEFVVDVGCGGRGTVNVNDLKAVEVLLGGKSVHVNLFRVKGYYKRTTDRENKNLDYNKISGDCLLPTFPLGSPSTSSISGSHENNNISVDRWAHILGNKSLRLVLSRVDS